MTETVQRATTHPGSRRRVRLGRLLAALTAIPIVFLTLFPSQNTETAGLFECLVCRERGVADALLNVLLFAPFGMALALARPSEVPTRKILQLPVLLSAGVELAQLVIPGRDASVGDLLFNSLGAGLGVLLARSASAWLFPAGIRSARLSLAAAVTVTGIFGATGALLRPSFPATQYYVQWTPDLAHLEPYRATISEAALGRLPLRPGIISNEEIREGILAGDLLRVQALAGPRIERLGSLLSVYDEHKREIFLIGPDRDDLIFRYRTRAARLRLDWPYIRVRDGLRGVDPGQELTVSVRAEPRGFCLGVGREPTCEFGFTLGSGWALLAFSSGLPEWAHEPLNGLWMLLLLLPVGYWSRRRWETAIALAGLILVVLGAPGAMGLRATPASELLAALAGFTSGCLARHLTERASRRTTPAPMPLNKPLIHRSPDHRPGREQSPTSYR